MVNKRKTWVPLREDLLIEQIAFIRCPFAWSRFAYRYERYYYAGPGDLDWRILFTPDDIC